MSPLPGYKDRPLGTGLLVRDLVETKVREVNTGLKGQEPLDFDPMLLVSSTAVAYPEQYWSNLQNWSSLSSEIDLQGEVLDFVTPILSIHYNEVCTVECCNCSQSDLNQIVTEAYNRKVLGDKSKSKIHASIPKTQRVRKQLKRDKLEANQVVTDSG